MKKIIIDHREHAAELVYLLKEKYNFAVNISQLKYGDYFIIPDVIIERKTVHDFVVSIIDGRLFQQAYKLSKLSTRTIILIEGKSFNKLNVNFKIKSVKGALITLAQTFGIPILRTINEADSAWYIT